MAETAAPAATTRPTRSRAKAPAKAAAPAKATPAKAAAAAAPAATNVTRFKVELEHVDTTKQYEKFAAPANMKGVVVGNLYAPIGTARMVVMVVGADDAGDE